MKITRFFCLTFLLATSVISAQKKEETLLTINGQPTGTDEFLSIYSKNLDMVQDEEQKKMDTYLELFIDYKLKTLEAYAQELDKEPDYVREFTRYQKQLSENYLFEHDITEELIREAYDRLQEEVNASHILLLTTYDDKPQDTLKKYNKIKEIREKALNGEDFTELVKTYSEEPSAKERAGALGYFKGFSMVYPFENAAYNTPVGGISEIIRTQFGYHILKVNARRPAPAEITAAHIMVALQKEGTTPEEAEKRINDIYKRIEQGENFDDLVSLSDDAPSAKNGGVIGRFGSGRLNAPAFEEAAFALENSGDVSKPVKTDFGWHIIKLVERHPVESYEDMKESLSKRIKEGERAKIVLNTVNQQIKQKYGFTKDETALDFFNEFVTDSLTNRKWEYDENHPKLKETIFAVKDKKYSYADFAEYIKERQKKGRISKVIANQVKEYYDNFEDEMLRVFFMDNLEVENKEYGTVISEYRNGLLIYDLMDKNIWEPSKNDSIGLENYYEKNKSNYIYKQRVDALIASASNENAAKQVQEMLSAGKTAEEIEQALNTEEKVDVIFTSGLFEIGHQALPEGFQAERGVSKIYSKAGESKSSVIVLVREILNEQQIPLEEARGRVMSDYQSHLERNMMERLRKKYDVKVNRKVLKKLKKEYEKS